MLATNRPVVPKGETRHDEPAACPGPGRRAGRLLAWIAGLAALAGCLPAPPAASAPPVVTVLLSGLDTVWELAWGADGRLYLTERPGRVQVWDGRALRPLLRLPVAERGEGGLMGLALHPRFPAEPYVYVCYTYEGDGLRNRVERLHLAGGGNRLERDRILLDGMEGAPIHDGCRLAFLPDGTLLVTMGDAGVAAQAQDPGHLNGKVLRVTAGGGIPPDNPYPSSPVFTLGHRNPQGLALRPGTGEIYVSEHGPETDDEINRLRPGRNYGWPHLRGVRSAPGFEPALWFWTPTIAPAGLAFAGPDTLYLATLKGSALRRLSLAPDGRITGDGVVASGFGRLRALTVGSDGCLYAGTSNRDGRGQPGPGDDRVLRVCF